MIAFTRPKMADTHTYAQRPPETVIPERILAVIAKATASRTQRMSRLLSMRQTIHSGAALIS
jgi:hypothetical protein